MVFANSPDSTGEDDATQVVESGLADDRFAGIPHGPPVDAPPGL